MFLYFLFLFSLWAEPINGTLLEQEIIPELNGKIESLESKISAKEEYFAGEGSLQNAFWEWSTAPLLSPLYLQSQLVLLQQEKMDREGQFFIQEEIDAPDSLREQFHSLETKHLSLISKEQMLKEQFLLRLLNNIPSSDVYRKTEHSLEYYSKILEGSDFENDKKIVLRVSKQEKRLRNLKHSLVIHFTLPKSKALSSYLEEEKSLAEEANERLEINGSIDRLQLISAIKSDSQGVQDLVNELQKKEEVFVQKEKETEFQQIQKTWKAEDFSEQELLSLETQLKESNQGLDSKIPIQNIQIQINQFKLEKIQQYFDQKIELESKKIEEELLVSQEKLEEAKREQEADQVLQDKIVSIREKETKIRTQESTRREEFLQWFNKFEASFLEQKKSNSDALALPPMDLERQKKIDNGYLETHELIRTLQEKILQIRKILKEINTEPFQHSTEEQVGKRLREAEEDLIKAIVARQNNLEQEQLVLVDLLIQIHQERRNISKESSFTMVEQVQDDFWREIQFELLLGPFMTYHHWNKFSDELKSFSWNIQLMARYFQFWFLIGIGILIWRGIRLRSGKLWTAFYSWIRLQKIELVSGKSFQLSTFTEESQEKQDKTIAIVPKVVDVFALFFAIILIKQEHFFIQMFLRTLLLIKSWQLVTPFIGIWYAKGELSSKLKRGVFYLIFYVLGLGLFSFVLLELFYAKRSVELLQFFRIILLWVLLSHQLGVWAPIVLKRVENTQGLGFLKKMINRNSDSWFGIRVKSFIGLIVIIIWFFNQVIFFVAEHSQIIGGLIAKNSLKQEEVDLEMLSLEDYSLIAQNNSKLMMLQTELEEIQQVFGDWTEERRRGLVAIVGRKGVGKTELLESFLDSVQGFSIRRIVKERNKDSILTEFERYYDQEFSNVTEIVSYLRTLDSEVICFDNLHHAMFRDVNGYQYIKDMLAIMQGTAHQHFWVVVCHYHSWAYLHSPVINVNLHIFRKEVFIKPKSFQELQHWVLERAEKLGFQLQFPEFSSLKTEEAKRRYQLAFWRVLADLSNGNPSVAELFWLDSLRKGDDENTLQMVLYSIPSSETLKGLQDTDYFVLASTLLHGGLSIEELQETLQVSFAVVQSSCRNLLGLGLIQKIDARYFIEPRWSASIEDILVTKRMIYLDF